MLGEPKLKTLQGFLETLTEEELIWINGYVAGLVSSKPAARPVVASNKKVTIVYGTESGNSKKLAGGFSAQAKKSGIQAKVVSLDQYRMSDLAKEENLLVVISTQGDGEPPAAAKKFYDHVHTGGLSLTKLNFGVLALGDTAYPLFCKAGEDVDSKLEEAGAKRLIPMQRCDTDYEEESQAWFNNLLNSLTAGVSQEVVVLPATKKSTKKNYTGTVISNVNLSGRGSAKQTHHVEIAADDLHYQPGDSIGVVPENPPALVNAILALAAGEADRKINFRNEEHTIANLLSRKLNIVYLPERVVAKYAQLVKQDIPPMRIDLLNLMKIYPVKDSAQFEEVIALLEPITPRLYSISSSPAAHSGEVHVTVARNSFTVNNEIQYGLCSDYFSALKENSTLEFYVHKNSQFKLPESERDVIMIGPGTGIAPFRSFIAERDATGAEGRNWLLFGEQHFASDFLYQTEIQSYVESGVLTKVSLAFSRDQAQKIYVQHRMVEFGHDLYQWLEAGAYLYLCGAKDPMSEDVESTLTQIIAQYGSKSPEDALSYVSKLKEENRYQKDVY